MRGHLLEAARHAEQQALGSALVATPQELASCIDAIAPEDFYNDLYGRIWAAMQSVYHAHGSADIGLIIDALAERGESIGAATDAIAQLIDCVASSAHLEHFVKKVRNWSALRRLSEDARRLVSQTERSTEAHEIIDSLQALAVRYASDGHSNGKVYGIGEILDMIRASIDNATECRWEVEWPLDCLRERLGPIRPGRLYVVGARPAMGKTTFLCDLVRLMDAPCCFVCLEGTAEDIGRQMIAATSGIQRSKLERPRFMTLKEIQQAMDAFSHLSDRSISIVAPSNRTLAHLRTICRKESSRGVRIIVIDYIQQLSDTSRKYSGDGRNWELGAIARGLTEIAREMEIAIIAASQLSRHNERRTTHIPRLSDLRESGEIEQEAHAVIFLHRPAYYDPQADDRCIVEIAKNRSGPKCRTHLRFVSHIPRFEQVPDGFFSDSEGAEESEVKDRSGAEKWYGND